LQQMSASAARICQGIGWWYAGFVWRGSIQA
jgi:hypothetical protein